MSKQKPMPTEVAKTLIAEFTSLIAEVPMNELGPFQADLTAKKVAGRGKVSVQGMILDAMDDGRLEGIDAHRLLRILHMRINGNSVGMCRVTKDGDLIAMGTTLQEEEASDGTGAN